MTYRVIIFIFCCSYLSVTAQKEHHYSLQLEHFYGSILKHKASISHLAISHPQAVSISYNKKTTAKDSILTAYNYPDYGLTFTYQDYKNEILGKSYGLQFHYNFYFGNRAKNNLFYLKLAQGVAYVTKPFNLENNNKNVAIGSHINANTSIGFNYKHKNIVNGLDGTIGVYVMHFSNGSTKPPNAGLNLISVSTGLTYNFDNKYPIDYSINHTVKNIKKKEPIRYNFQVSGGVNSSDNLLNRQFPYYIITAYADKRLNTKSTIQLGSEVFFSKFLKEVIKYNAIAFPEKVGETGNADYKRVSLLVGHELAINKFSIITQLGYYVYYPYKYETRYYERLGVKRYFGNKVFATLSIKAHIFAAESLDLGIGIRL